MFYISPIVKRIMIICIIIFFIQHNLFNNDLVGDFFNKTFALHSVYSEHFNSFQLVSYAFLHADLSHILLNLLGLWVFGTRLEEIFGAKKFINFTLLSAIGSAVVHLIYLYLSQMDIYQYGYNDPYFYYNQQIINAPTMGLSGVVYACMAAFAYLFPRDNIYVYFIIPIQVRWLVLILIGYEVIELMAEVTHSSSSESSIAHFAHLGGAAVGFAWVYFQYKKNNKRYY